MRQIATGLLVLGFLSACAGTKPTVKSGDPDEPPPPVFVTCDARTPAASWRRTLTFVGAVPEDREPERLEWDLLELAGRMGLNSCPPTAAGAGPRAEVLDAVLTGDPLTRDSYVRFLLDTEAEAPLAAALIVGGFVQDPVMDSRVAASSLAGLLHEIERVSEVSVVPSAEASEAMAHQEAQAAAEAALLAPIQGMSPEEQDSFAVELFCRTWAEQDPTLSFDERHAAVRNAAPILEHTDWPAVLAMAALGARWDIATKVAEIYGHTEVCQHFHRDLEAWLATQAQGE